MLNNSRLPSVRTLEGGGESEELEEDVGREEWAVVMRKVCRGTVQGLGAAVSDFWALRPGPRTGVKGTI